MCAEILCTYTENAFSFAALAAESAFCFGEVLMGLLEELEAEGADIEGGLQRLGNKTDFYIRMLRRLPGLMEEKPVTVTLIQEEPARAAENAHAIKGTAGNLSITPLYESYSKIVARLRENDSSAAASALKEILPVQGRILSIIEKYR